MNRFKYFIALALLLTFLVSCQGKSSVVTPGIGSSGATHSVSSADNDGSVAIGEFPGLVDEEDPYAEEVAEYLRTGIPVLIPKWGDKFELPYIGPILTRDGIIEPEGMPVWTPEVNIKSEDADSALKEASKIGLPWQSPATKGTARHVFLLARTPSFTQSRTAGAVYEKIFDDNAGRTCPSLHDFYYEMSYGQLEITGDVFPSSGAYSASSDNNINTILVDVLNAALADGVDFSDYDGDDDGRIDSLTIILPFNIRAFVFFTNITGLSGKSTHALGFLGIDDLAPESRTAHHEMGHFFYLPDYYDRGGDGLPPSPGPDGNESLGNGLWELMSAGNFVNPPMHTSGYNKWLLDWLEPVVVDTDVVDLVLHPSNYIDQPSQVYLLWTDGIFNREFFLIENRWRSDAKGLMIWHVDEDVYISQANNVGVNYYEEHKALDLEEADGKDNLDHKQNFGDNGDLYPYSGKDFQFESYPSSEDYDGNDSQIMVFNIRKDTGAETITVDIAITALTFDLNSLPPLVGGGEIEIVPNVNEKVERVELFIDSAKVFDSEDPPYVYPWDTSSSLYDEFTITGLGYGGGDIREVIQDILIDNMPMLYPLADNAESGFFQFFPLDAKHPAFSLKSATRTVPGTPDDLEENGRGEWRQRLDFHTSGERSFYIGRGAGVYDNFENDYLVSRKIDLSGATIPMLSFSHKYDIEDGGDYARVFITTDDGATFTLLTSFTGVGDENREFISLDDYIGEIIRIVFFFESDGGITDEDTETNTSGWWIDDIVVGEGAAGTLPTVEITEPDGDSFLSGKIDASVLLAGDVSYVKYFLFHKNGTLTSKQVNPPYSTSILTASLGNQRVLLEARAVTSDGYYSSDIVELDLYNLVGDVNGDGVVSEDDLGAILDNFGLASTHPGYRPWIDCNGDGVVDERDAAIVGYNFGSTL